MYKMYCYVNLADLVSEFGVANTFISRLCSVCVAFHIMTSAVYHIMIFMLGQGLL